MYLQGTATQGSPGKLAEVSAFNRGGLTDAEHLAWYKGVVAEADRGASQAAGLIPAPIDFTSGWSTTGTASVTDADTISLPATNDSVRRTFAVDAGRNYLIRFTGTTTQGIRLLSFDLTTVIVSLVTGTFDITLVVPLTSAGIAIRNVSGLATTVDVTQLQVTRRGQTTHLHPSAIQSAPGQWIGAVNNSHAHIPPLARLDAFAGTPLIRGRNTWAASDASQFFNGADMSVIPSNAYIDTLVIVPSATHAGNIQIGNGVDATYYAEVLGPFAANIPVVVGLKTSVPTGGNLKVTLKPTIAYTGNIRTSGFCRMLEL